MKPSDIYQQQVNTGEIGTSDSQLEVVQFLDEYYEHFHSEGNSSLHGGIYLWGTVGSGKTMLLDIFYNELPQNKQRLHFHEFINQIHAELKTVTHKKDPLNIITKEFAKHTKFLLLDELIINDISNAMILKNLFFGLIQAGVFIMTSSNTAPNDLYLGRINRELFLPAIDFITANFTIINLNSDIDYRSLNASNSSNYFYPKTKQTEQLMLQQFEKSSQNINHSVTNILVCSRNIDVIKMSDTSIWFNFADIIMPPRSYQDYLYLACNFANIFISNVRSIAENEINLIYNFCHLVDICYDKSIRLVLAADCALEEIFAEHSESKTILRTKSRLIAMQNFS